MESSPWVYAVLGMVVSEIKNTLMPGHPAFALRKKSFHTIPRPGNTQTCSKKMGLMRCNSCNSIYRMSDQPAPVSPFYRHRGGFIWFSFFSLSAQQNTGPYWTINKMIFFFSFFSFFFLLIFLLGWLFERPGQSPWGSAVFLSGAEGYHGFMAFLRTVVSFSCQLQSRFNSFLSIHAIIDRRPRWPRFSF